MSNPLHNYTDDYAPRVSRFSTIPRDNVLSENIFYRKEPGFVQKMKPTQNQRVLTGNLWKNAVVVLLKLRRHHKWTVPLKDVASFLLKVYSDPSRSEHCFSVVYKARII